MCDCSMYERCCIRVERPSEASLLLHVVHPAARKLEHASVSRGLCLYHVTIRGHKKPSSRACTGMPVPTLHISRNSPCLKRRLQNTWRAKTLNGALPAGGLGS